MRLLILNAWISCLLLLQSMGIELRSSNLLAQSPLPTELSCQAQLCLTSFTKSLWILFSNYNFHLNTSFSQWRLLGKWDTVSVSHLTCVQLYVGPGDLKLGLYACMLLKHLPNHKSLVLNAHLFLPIDWHRLLQPTCTVSWPDLHYH